MWPCSWQIPSRSRALLRGGDVEIGAEAGKLLGKARIAEVDDVDAGDPRSSRGGQGCDQVAEAAAEVWDVDVGSLELGRSGDDGRVEEVPLAEPAWNAAQAFPVHLDAGAH